MDPTPPFPSDTPVRQVRGDRDGYRSEETAESHRGPHDRSEAPELRPNKAWWD